MVLGRGAVSTTVLRALWEARSPFVLWIITCRTRPTLHVAFTWHATDHPLCPLLGPLHSQRHL